MTNYGGPEMQAYQWHRELTARAPQGYREQDGCHNCRSVLERFEHGEGIVGYYCLLDAPHPRPPTWSVAMGECCFDRPYKKDRYDASDRYYDPREVEPWGKCTKWVIIPGDTEV